MRSRNGNHATVLLVPAMLLALASPMPAKNKGPPAPALGDNLRSAVFRYTEADAWSESDKKMYARYQAKRERMEAEEAANLQALIASQTAEAP